MSNIQLLIKVTIDGSGLPVEIPEMFCDWFTSESIDLEAAEGP